MDRENTLGPLNRSRVRNPSTVFNNDYKENLSLNQIKSCESIVDPHYEVIFFIISQQIPK